MHDLVWGSDLIVGKLCLIVGKLFLGCFGLALIQDHENMIQDHENTRRNPNVWERGEARKCRNEDRRNQCVHQSIADGWMVGSYLEGRDRVGLLQCSLDLDEALLRSAQQGSERCNRQPSTLPNTQLSEWLPPSGESALLQRHITNGFVTTYTPDATHALLPPLALWLPSCPSLKVSTWLATVSSDSGTTYSDRWEGCRG